MRLTHHVATDRRSPLLSRVDLLAILLVGLIVTTIAVPAHLVAVRKERQRICRANLVTIAHAVDARRVWSRARDYRALIIGGVTMANLPDLTFIPTCPDGGQYILSPGADGTVRTFKITCSADGGASGSDEYRPAQPPASAPADHGQDH